MNDGKLLAMRSQLLNEVREAEAALSTRSLAAQSRYSNALYELDRLERLINRLSMERHHGFSA
jgi:hypothetical protein